jgi:hypothetical protein
MVRPLRLALAAWLPLVVAHAGCGSAPAPADLAVVGDLAVPPPDLAPLACTGVGTAMCPEGFLCSAIGAAAAVCQKRCMRDDACAGDERCGGGPPGSPSGSCIPTCTPFAAGCASGLDCSGFTFGAGSSPEFPFCRPLHGSTPAFGACTLTNETCGAATTCNGTTRSCMPLCDDDHPCPSSLGDGAPGDGGGIACHALAPGLYRNAGFCR